MASEDDCYKNFILNILDENGPRLYSYLQMFERLTLSTPPQHDIHTLLQKDMDKIQALIKKQPKEARDRLRLWLPFIKILFQSLRMKHGSDPVRRLKCAIAAFMEYDPIFRINPHRENPKSQTRRNWQIPILVYTLKLLKECALNVSPQHIVNDMQELSRQSRNLILFCQNVDTDVDVSMSRFKAIPFVVNAILIVLISSNQTDQCRSFLLAVEAMQKQGSVFLDCATRAQFVIYQFYLGRMRLLERNFKGASDAFRSAFEKLPTAHPNKRIALFYATISNLLCGLKVRRELCDKYDLHFLNELTDAVENASYSSYKAFVLEHKGLLMDMGIYTLFLHLESEIHFYSLQRSYALSKRIEDLDVSRLPVACVCEFMKKMGASSLTYSEEVVMDSISGILAAKRAMGYLSRAHKTVVLSKSSPFP